MFIAAPVFTLIALISFSLCYGTIYLILRKYLLRKAKERIEANKNRYMISQEALIGIKEIKVRHATNIYLQNFKNATEIFHRLRINTSLAKLIPTLFIQISASGGILITIIILLSRLKENYSEVIPLVALYAFAGFRIMPVIQGIFRNLTSLRSGKPALELLHKELVDTQEKRELIKQTTIPSIKEELLIENITFSYPDSKYPVINNLSLSIKANTSIAFVGSTGMANQLRLTLFLVYLNRVMDI